MNHLIDLDDYPVSAWNSLLDTAQDIIAHEGDYADSMRGKIMATLFFEPSTRTQLSFQSAMLRLGGQIIGFDNPLNSSVSKGENIKDTLTVVSGYSDVIVIRHPLEGCALASSLFSRVPVINAGDGGHLHPTQTLTDLLTLRRIKGTLSGLTIGMCGDLKNGRTVHSLLKAMSCYPGNRFVFVSTPELRLPDTFLSLLRDRGCTYSEHVSLEEVMGSLDMLYMTRIQKERFPSMEEYQRQKDVYRLTVDKLALGRPDLIVLHPLPRVDEIAIGVDDDPRARYFEQAIYGRYVRMALVQALVGGTLSASCTPAQYTRDERCQNPGCISNHELYLPPIYKREGEFYVCRYCDRPL